jgi:hypothetical protein
LEHRAIFGIRRQSRLYGTFFENHDHRPPLRYYPSQRDHDWTVKHLLIVEPLLSLRAKSITVGYLLAFALRMLSSSQRFSLPAPSLGFQLSRDSISRISTELACSCQCGHRVALPMLAYRTFAHKLMRRHVRSWRKLTNTEQTLVDPERDRPRLRNSASLSKGTFSSGLTS